MLEFLLHLNMSKLLQLLYLLMILFSTTVLAYNKDMTLDPNTTDYSGHPYPFGMDPVGTNLNTRSYIFKYLTKYLNNLTLLTFVRPILDYCSNLWRPCRKTVIDLI